MLKTRAPSGGDSSITAASYKQMEEKRWEWFDLIKKTLTSTNQSNGQSLETDDAFRSITVTMSLSVRFSSDSLWSEDQTIAQHQSLMISQTVLLHLYFFDFY